MTDALDRAASLLTGEPTHAGVSRYEREVLASQLRAPDYYAQAKAEQARLGLSDAELEAHLLAECVARGLVRR